MIPKVKALVGSLIRMVHTLWQTLATKGMPWVQHTVLPWFGQHLHTWRSAGKNSLRLRLLAFFGGFLFVAWSATALIAWSESSEAIDEFFDTQQMLFAQRLAAGNLPAGATPLAKPVTGAGKKAQGKLEDEALAFAVFTTSGELVMADGENGQRFPFMANARGFTNTHLHGDDEPWRIVWLASINGNHIVAVGQELEFRQEMVLDMLTRQLVPWLVLLPVLLLGLMFFLSRELAPLGFVATQLAAKEPQDTTPLDVEKIPAEVQPIVQSLNNYFTRAGNMLHRERAFIADAAHELRTPLAGLRVQAQVALQKGLAPDKRNEALNFLAQGVDRCSRLVEQLLALSRLEAAPTHAQPHVAAQPMAPIAWSSLLHSVVPEYSHKAEAKNVALHIIEQEPCLPCQANQVLVFLLLRNLLDNAVRYTPPHGTITITLNANSLDIVNTALPIAPEYAQRLGERFFRPPGQTELGSGLGLSIVQRIAGLHGFTCSAQPAIVQGASVFRVALGWPCLPPQQ